MRHTVVPRRPRPAARPATGGGRRRSTACSGRHRSRIQRLQRDQTDTSRGPRAIKPGGLEKTTVVVVQDPGRRGGNPRPSQHPRPRWIPPQAGRRGRACAGSRTSPLNFTMTGRPSPRCVRDAGGELRLLTGGGRAQAIRRRALPRPARHSMRRADPGRSIGSGPANGARASISSPSTNAPGRSDPSRSNARRTWSARQRRGSSGSRYSPANCRAKIRPRNPCGRRSSRNHGQSGKRPSAKTAPLSAGQTSSCSRCTPRLQVRATCRPCARPPQA
jgi:hypothetical protein